MSNQPNDNVNKDENDCDDHVTKSDIKDKSETSNFKYSGGDQFRDRVDTNNS